MTAIGYVDVAYANEYVEQHFLSTDVQRISWESLDEADKEVLLRRSFEALELLPFSGRKYSMDQKTAFPRYPDKEVPEAIKAAQVENALVAADSSDNEESAFYEKLWRFGVESYSVGNLSESSGSGAWGSQSPSTSGISSARAFRLLQPLLQGGYCVRGRY